MNRALLYLVVVQRKNSAISFVKGLRSPGRAAAAMVWIGFVGLFLLSSSSGFSSAMRRESAQAALPALFSILLLTSTINGLLQRGLTFQEADIDFLFPGPFSRRELVMYRLLTLYPFALVSSAVFLLMLRRICGHAGASYLALVLFSCLLIHLQTILGLVATWIEGGLLRRVRSSLRVVAWMLAIVLAFAFIGAATGDHRVASFVDRVFAIEAARVAFYPAAKVAQALAAPNFVGALHGLLPLFAAAVVSLVVVLLLQVNFLEASLQTSQQGSLLRARWSRGFLSADRASPTASSARMPRGFLFRGAGAIVWKNLVAASRSLRFVLYAVLSIGIYTALVIVRGKHGGPGIAGPNELPVDAIVPPRMEIIGLGAMWPLFIQQYVAFDFRRDFDSLAELRQLPLRPFSVAAAELTVPTILTLAFQSLGLLGVACFEDVSRSTLWVALFAYPPVTLAMLTVTNLGFLLFPSRQAASSRGRAGATFSIIAIFNMFATLVSLAPAIVVGALVWAAQQAEFEDLSAVSAYGVADPGYFDATLAFAATQWIVAIVLLSLLGRVYARFNVAREMG